MGRPSKEIDTEVLYDLIESGTRKKDIACELGLSGPTLSKKIAQIQQDQGILLQYRALQNLQLTDLQAKILEAITPDKIEAAPLRDLVIAYKVLKEKEQVLTGKPTDLKGMMHYLIEIEREELAAKSPVQSLEEITDGEWTEGNDLDSGKLPNL